MAILNWAIKHIHISNFFITLYNKAARELISDGL